MTRMFYPAAVLAFTALLTLGNTGCMTWGVTIGPNLGFVSIPIQLLGARRCAVRVAVPLEGGLPLLHEVQRNNVRIVKEKIADYVDPPRHVPVIGPAQLHHAHYKCTIYYTEVVRVGWPVPHTLVDEDEREVIYIDHNHFHMVCNVDTGAGAEY